MGFSQRLNATHLTDFATAGLCQRGMPEADCTAGGRARW